MANSGSAELRRQLGRRYRVTDVCRLDPGSAYYRPKTRRAGTPARVHPVRLILSPGSDGQCLDRRPFRLTPLPDVDGVPLRKLAAIRLAPWLGPAGIFLVDDSTTLPREYLVPVVETRDINGDRIGPPRRWALVTGDAEPPPAILAHLDATLVRMPAGGRRAVRWQPPERFAGRLPLAHDAVLVPRIALRLRAIRLPAGRLPVNHQLVIVSGFPASALIAMLEDPAVQAQAEALALPVENDYRSYTATLLRQLVVPWRHLGAGHRDEARPEGRAGTRDD